MEKTKETTYECAFRPRCSCTCHNRKLGSKYSTASRDTNQVRLLLFDPDLEKQKVKKKRRSSSCQTGDDLEIEPYNRYRKEVALSNAPSCYSRQAYSSPPPNYLPVMFIEQSPIPGVYTGSPGLQVPSAGFNITPSMYQSNGPFGLCPAASNMSHFANNNWPQPSQDTRPMNRSICPHGKVQENTNVPGVPSRLPMRFIQSQLLGIPNA